MLEKKILQDLIAQKFSTRGLARELKVSQATVKHYLKKYNLKTEHNQWRKGQSKKKVSGNVDLNGVCDICKRRYPFRKGVLCMTCRTNVNRLRKRVACIRYLGGTCTRCGWKGNISCYDIHHKDPSKKTFEFSHVHTLPWAVIEQELKDSELLCAICHRIEHSRAKERDLIKYVFDYKGKLDIGKLDPVYYSQTLETD